MKIVHLCLSSFYICGYAYQENMLAKYHKLMGYDVVVIASCVSFDLNGKPCIVSPGIYYDSNIKVIRLEYKKGILYRFNKRLRRYNDTYNKLEEERPDIIFIHGTSFCDVNYISSYKKKYPNTIIYADSHADWINSGRNWISLYIQHKILWRLTTKVIENISEKIWGTLPIRCDFLRKVYKVSEDKIDFLPIGFDNLSIINDTEEIRNHIINDVLKIDETNGVFLITTGGKIDSLKNTHLLMKAVNSLKDSRIHLVIFGTVVPEFRSVFNNLMSDNIHFVGWCTPSETVDYMIASDLICFPGTHSTLWEQAVGLSKPSIFKYWKGIDHVNICDNCIFLYDDNEEEIKAIIKKLIYDNSYYESVKHNAEKAAEYFCYSNIAKRAIGL